MSSPAVLSSYLSALPPRPPTPPREAHHEAAAPNRQSLPFVDSRSSVHTPPGLQSPASSDATTSTSRRARKKVGFSAQAEYKDPPVYPDGEGVIQHPTPVSLPRSASKPVKSILKVTANPHNLLDSTAGNDCNLSNPQISVSAMLESTLQQLAGGDRDSKLDAYLMLTRAWKASNNLPDRVALQEKMTLFTQFMQRDIVAKTPEGSLDSSLVNHALNLLNTFLHFPAISSTISNDFGVFIIDHCIHSFEDASTPKDTARRLMQVISLQNFSPKVMTADRVGRLVSSLHNIEEHLKGKSIILSRVLIYRKLVQQSRQLMIIHADWLLDMFTDMLSNLRDIRSAAIALGLEAAFSIGHEKQLSRKVMEVFNLSYEDKRYIQYYEEKLKTMTKDKHESAVVPHIWSVVILLLRIRLDKWEFAGPWLHIIQNCFNSTDFPTKIAANHAWARLVYLMHLEERALPKNLSTLTTPLISQLRRRGSGKTSEELRQAVLGGICNLFYYAFKPNTSSTLLDTYWDTSVRPVLTKLLDPAAEAAHDNLRQASLILGGLFDCTTPRRWRVDHIVESPLVKPDELPPIESKWIRQNTNRVFGVIEPILEQDFFALSEADSATYKLWRSLVSTVASAAAKEIKVSKDTASFVGVALNTLQKVWKRGVSEQEGTEGNVTRFLISARAYLDAMISLLGRLPFTEKAGKHQASTKAPLYTLFSMLSTLPPGVPDERDYADFFGSVFAPFFASKGDRAKMELAQDLMSVIPMDAPRPYGPWLLVAENISSWLEPVHNSHHSTGSAGETPVGHDYRDVVKVLERGIRSTPNLPPKHWESFFHTVHGRVREETGDAGAAILVIEPLAKVLAEQSAAHEGSSAPLSRVAIVTELVSVATQPRDRQAVDAARKRLWGTVFAGSRSSSFDPFDNLYKAVSDILESSYDDFGAVNVDSTVQLFKEIGRFFDRCNRQLFLRTMLALQDGLLPWIQDGRRLLGSQANSVFASVKSLWDKLARLIGDIDHPEQQLQCLDWFFRASFASCHRVIVNSAISLWNGLFENVGQLDYPEELKAALAKIQPHADIVLPGMETSSSEYAGQRLSFIDSFEDFSFSELPSTRSSNRRGTSRPTSSHSKSPEMPPQTEPAASDRRTTTPRTKHDDSQVHFATIEPSELDSPAASQILTERQKEVRERQRETAALFPHIRSSPGPKAAKDPDRQMLPVGPQMRHATPEAEARFDDYVSSTPTPRRGQLVVMPEHDMTDPPSSPPELRGNPLAAEIRSRSASHSLLEEWQFSSSPVSGSPNPGRHGVVPDPSSQRGYVSVVSLPEVPSSPAKEEEDKAASQSTGDEVVEDSMIFEPANAAAAPTPWGTLAGANPSTPRRSTRLSQARARETPTPKSDGEEFVDAPNSPLPPTPKPSVRTGEANQESDGKQALVIPADNTSFDISDVDESSLFRLVVELDSGKADRSEYHRPSPSVSPDGKAQSPPVVDCIVVGESPQKSEASPPLRKTRASSAASAISSHAEAQNMTSSQPRARVGRSKRKRATSKAQETGAKRQRHDPAEESREVPHIQETTVLDMAVEVQGSAEAPEVSTGLLGNIEKEDIPEERIPSSSAEPSSSEYPSQESGPQKPTVPRTGNGMQFEEEDDQEVQSQIAHESSQHQEEGASARSGEAFAIPVSAGEQMQVDVQQPINTNQEEDAKVVSEEEERVSNVERGAAPEPTQAQKIMDLFRSGLDELRSARLSREQVYQIEDMFMDMRRELYEAERRGRG
ncbi:Rap1-interacting factor 1 N terminal-domain-containing protein [Thermothelomyces heterothallicus CBS 202.75]|uniref:Rap1-interacting factor 1 N terminal-domain-containing protein n=1 Tax=Thermothelomyces heterothallicus CBS 202.75 TaxID=1149848 RepID=UPI003742EE0C